MINWQVVSLDLCKRVWALRKKYRKLYNNIQIGFEEKLIKCDEEYANIIIEYGLDAYEQAVKLNNAYYSRRKRLFSRVSNYLQFPCVFLTLTFKNKVLKATTEKTRRQYVRRFLKSISNHFVANIDYGDDDRYTHREHYHCLVVGNITKKDCKWWTKNMGFKWIETVRNDGKSEDLISKYIAKLTSHAIKKSTRRHVYIYSRDN